MIMKTFTDKLTESVLIVNSDIDLLPKSLKKERYFYGQWFYIIELYVPKKHRNKGIASKLINKMIKWANKNKYSLILEVTPYEGSTYNKLVKFYEKFGFKYTNGYMIKRYYE